MIIFSNVSKKYFDNSALENINFTIDKGSFVFLVGPTGSGKTTIFRLIIRDLLPTEGKITVGEWDIQTLPKGKVPNLRRKVGVVFQDLKLLFDRTILENVTLPLEFAKVKPEEAKKRAQEILMEVGLSEKENKFPLQLSGGERQRVAIARALVFNPEILIADEPTGNLDIATSLQILDLLKSINKKGTTIFMATHNDRIINETQERIIILERGKLLEDKQKKVAHKKEEEKKEKEKEKGEKNAS